MRMDLVLRFHGQYILEPYTRARYDLIEIIKKSGGSRCRSDAAKRKAIEAYLTKIGMTWEGYLELEKEAAEPLRNEAGKLIVPADQFSSAIVSFSATAPSAMRIENSRVAITPSEFVFDRDKADGIWSRFAVVRQGAGKKLSNMRGLRESPHIQGAVLTGYLDFEPTMVNPLTIFELLEFGGRVVGMGASRGMARGRFVVESPKRSDFPANENGGGKKKKKKDDEAAAAAAAE